MKLYARKNGKPVSLREFFAGYEEFREGTKLHSEFSADVRLIHCDISSLEAYPSENGKEYDLVYEGSDKRVYHILLSRENDILTLEYIS